MLAFLTSEHEEKVTHEQQLKDWGHKIIELLVILGEDREKIYRQLARRMGKDRAHFADTNEVSELIQMNLWLRKQYQYRLEKMEKWKKRIAAFNSSEIKI